MFNACWQLVRILALPIQVATRMVILIKCSEANHVIHDSSLVRGSVVRIKSYQANMVKGKKCVSRNTLQFIGT